MKLVLHAPDETTLQLELGDFDDRTSKQLTLDDAQIQSLRHLYKSYQATINHSENKDVLFSIGHQLFGLINQHPDIVLRWLNNVGRHQLEIRTSLIPNALQSLLLNLPWEVMVWNNQFLAADTVLYEVVRRVGEANSASKPARYRDMTLVFMAADPDFNSGLDYENEERAILQATRKAKNLNLWVEESGNLDRLTQRITESGHCDMVHISCHGGYDDKLSNFALQLEDDLYRLKNVTARNFRGVAQHVQCLFLSACHTAETTETPAFAMELAKTGIANVIGWDGSVSDEDATVFAAEVYHALLQQATVPFACAAARQHLLQEYQRTGKHPHWHLGRVYLAPGGGLPLIDSSKPTSPKRRGKSFHELLDRKKNLVPVASKETFVGRRRQTKQALKVFTENSSAGILLTGIGGSGKSSLAARIVHRMEPQYKSAIIYMDYSEAAILGELRQLIPGDSRNEDFQRYLTDIRLNPDFFANNLVSILEESLSEQPIILVVDDLEQHALEKLISASKTGGKVRVKRVFQNALQGVIEAFSRADTESRLILTSRHNFSVLDGYGRDVAEELLQIEVPDMNSVEQEKHWLAILQSGVEFGVRDHARDRAFLKQIWATCQGNPGLQDVLYQPLLKGEYAVLEIALSRLQAYHAGQVSYAPPASLDDVDKYLQRIALEAYHSALTDTERQCLRILSLFDFAVPEQLITQAGTKLGIEHTQEALQRLDNFGLLTHWQGPGLEGHISCYGLARKIVEPLSNLDRKTIAAISSPLLWHIWFADFLKQYAIPTTESFSESIKIILDTHFPPRCGGEMPLQSHRDQRRLAWLNRLCIANSLSDWEVLGFQPSEFIDLIELSLSLHTFEKLRITAAAVDNLSHYQLSELYKLFSEERDKFKELAKEHPLDIISLLLKQFGGRPELLSKGYQINFGVLTDGEIKLLESINIQNSEDRLVAGIQLAKTKIQKSEAYGKYANFLAEKNHDYTKAEVMYQRAVAADPTNAIIVGDFAAFLQKFDIDMTRAEELYLNALSIDPEHENNNKNYAIFLAAVKNDLSAAEARFDRLVDKNPDFFNDSRDYVQTLDEEAQLELQQQFEALPVEYAEILIKKAIKQSPNDTEYLSDYAQFLADRKHDYKQAELMFERALEVDPNCETSLGNYANFLANHKQDYTQADATYRRALEATPNCAITLGNYAKLLYVTGQEDKAQQYLERAEMQTNLAPSLKIEFAFYRYAHCTPHVLTPVKLELQSGSRSIDWNLSNNVKRASEDNHPFPELLAAIAKVISGERGIETLDQYSKWNEIS